MPELQANSKVGFRRQISPSLAGEILSPQKESSFLLTVRCRRL